MPTDAAFLASAPIGLIGALIAVAVGYVLGSVPFGLIVTRLAGLGDVRRIGSGNIGATNVLRTGKKWAAALTLLLDGGKGAAAVLIAYHFYGIFGAGLAGFAALMGHVFPVWLRFRGGKGVATSLGVMLAAFWPAGLAMIATWLAVAFGSRYSSLSALTAALLAPFYCITLGSLHYALLGLAITAVIFATHRDNINRLLHGTEPRIGERK
jgi:acyl phosphate:glycerol-3-phosphate acyltransferase